MPDQLPSAILDSTNSADSLFALELDTKQRFDNILLNQQNPINYPIPDFQKDMYPNGLSQTDLLNPSKTKGTLGEAMFSPDIKIAQYATDSIRNLTSKLPTSQGVGVPDRFSYDKMMNKFLNSDAGYNPYTSIEDNEAFNYLYNYDNKTNAGKVLSTFGHGLSRFVGGLVLKLGQTVGYTGGLIGNGIEELFELAGGPKNNFMADVADNSLARWFQQQEQSMKDSNALAVFKPSGWEDKGFFSKLGYGSFWSDEISDGAAFMGEMIASMYLLGGLGKIGPLAKFGETAIDFGAHGFGKAATSLAKLATGADDIQGVGRWAFSVASEAAFEAAEGFDKSTETLRKERDRGLNNLTDEQIRSISGDRAAARYRANLLVLSASNAFENRMIFGNLFKKNAIAQASAGERGKSRFSKLIGLSDDNSSLGTLAQASRRQYKYSTKLGKFTDWKNSNSRLRFYGSKGLSAVGAEGFWEENAQLAAERLSSTDNLSLSSFTHKLGQQTIDALMGRDPEASTNIGLGGVIGIGGVSFGAKIQQGSKQIKDKDGNLIDTPVYLKGERRNLEDNVQRAINNYEEYRIKFLNFNDIYITDTNGKPIPDEDGNMQIDEAKAAGLIDGINKFTSKQAAIDDIYDPLLKQHMQNEAALDYVAAAKAVGIFNRALTKFENINGLDVEQLKKLGFDPNTIVDAGWLKDSVKQAGQIYDEVYNGPQPQMKKGDTKADDENRKFNLYKSKSRSISATKISEEYRKAMEEKGYVSTFSPEIDDQDNVLQEYNALIYQVSRLAQMAQLFGENGSFYKEYLEQQQAEMEKNSDKLLKILMPKITNRQLAASEEGFLLSKARWERLYGKQYTPPMMPTAVSDALLLEIELGAGDASTGLRTEQGKPVRGQVPIKYITLKDLGSIADYTKVTVSEQARVKAATLLSMEHENLAKYAELKNVASQNKFLADKFSHPVDGMKNFKDYKTYLESLQKKDIEAESKTENPNNPPTDPLTNIPTGQPAPIAEAPVSQQGEPTNPPPPAPPLNPKQVIDSSGVIQKLTDAIIVTFNDMVAEEDKTDVDVSDIINIINENWDAHKDAIRSVLQKELIDKYITPLKTKLDNKTLKVPSVNEEGELISTEEDQKITEAFEGVNNIIEAMGQFGLNQEATQWLDNRSYPIQKALEEYEGPEEKQPEPPQPPIPTVVTTYNVGDKVKINTPKDGEGIIKEDRGDKVLLEDGRQVKKENVSPIEKAPEQPKEDRQKQYASKLKEILERRKLATQEDLKNSQLIQDIRVDKSQSNVIKPNEADKNLTSIMLYGHRYDDLSDIDYIYNNISTISNPDEMRLEAETLAYRILNNLLFNLEEINEFFEEIKENPEYASALTTNENPVKEFFENDIFEQVEKDILEITPQQKQQAQQLYSQYLEQNPDGSIEQFKNWVDRNNINKPLFSLSTNNIKSGVSELFESNPELANEVYEALGFKTESSSNTITRDIKEELPFKVIGNYNEIDEGLIGRKFYEEKIGNDLYRFEISNYSYPNEDGSSESFYDIDFTVNGSEEVIGTGFFDKAERAKQILQALLSQNFGNDTVRFNVEESKKGKQRLSLYKRLMNQLGYNPSGEMEYALFYNTNTFLSPSDKIVFGHPTIGKSYLKQKGNNEFITLDDDYADEVSAFVDANRGSETRQEYKGRKPKEYNQFMLNLFDRLKIQAQKEGKKLFVSNTNILKERMSDFDKVITMPKDEFKKRFDARGATYGFEDWKSDIDATVAKVPINKIINTTGYLSDLFKPSNEIGKINLTPQQKQQAQQLYSQYLDTIFPDSKVKDIVYHGSPESFEQFDKSKLGSYTGAASAKEGIFFGSSIDVSKSYLDKRGQTLNLNQFIENKYGKDVSDKISKGFNYIASGLAEKVLGYKPERVTPDNEFDDTYGIKLKDGSILYDNGDYKGNNKNAKFLQAFIKRQEELKSSYDENYGGYIDKNRDITDKPFENLYIRPIILSISNPLITSDEGKTYREESYFERIKNAKEQNKDGVVIQDTYDSKFQTKPENVYVVFEPEQTHILGSKQDIERFKKFVTQPTTQSVKSGVPELFESNPELADSVYEALGFKQKQYASKLKEISERRKLATKWDLENSQLIKDIRVDKTQPKELKPNAADNNLASIMLYGHRYSDLSNMDYVDDNLSTITNPAEMQSEAEVLAYRILNDLLFDIKEINEFYEEIKDNPEYVSALTTNENPVKEFFENDIFEQVEKTLPPVPPKPPVEEPPINNPPVIPPPVGNPAKNTDDEERESNNTLDIVVDAARRLGQFTLVQNYPEMIVTDAKGNPVIIDGVLQLKTTQGPQQEQGLRQHRVLQKMGSKAEDINFWSEDKEGNRMFRVKLLYGTDANKQKYEKWVYRTDLGKVDEEGNSYNFPKIIAVITDREGNPVYFNLQGEITTKASGQPIAFPYSVQEYLVRNLDISREGILKKTRKPLAGGSNYIAVEKNGKMVKDPLGDIASLVQKGVDIFGDIDEVTSGRLSTFDIDNNPSVTKKESYQRRTVKQLKEDGVINDESIEILKEGNVWEYITDVNGKQQQRIQVGQPYLFDNRSGLAISLNTRTLRELVYKGKPFLQGKLKELLEGFSKGEVIDEKTGLKSYSIEIDLANASVEEENSFKDLYTFLRAMFYSQDILITMNKEGDKISYIDNRSEHIPLMDTSINYSTNIATLDVPYTDNQIDDYDDFMSENLLSGAILAEVEKGKKEFAKVNKRITFTLDKNHAQVLDALGVVVPIKPTIQILDNMNSFVGKTYMKKGTKTSITVISFKDGIFTIKGENGKEVTKTTSEFMSAVKKLQEVKLPEPTEETNQEFTDKIKLSKDKIKDLNNKSKESTEDDFKDDDFGC